jgi:hypothetical protein
LRRPASCAAKKRQREVEHRRAITRLRGEREKRRTRKEEKRGRREEGGRKAGGKREGEQ